MIWMAGFWLVVALVVVANGLVFRARAERFGAEQPTLLPGYRELANGFMKWLTPPMLVIAAGVALGWSNIFAAKPGTHATASAFDLVVIVLMFAILLRSMCGCIGRA